MHEIWKWVAVRPYLWCYIIKNFVFKLIYLNSSVLAHVALGTNAWLIQCQWNNHGWYGKHRPISNHNKTQQSVIHVPVPRDVLYCVQTRTSVILSIKSACDPCILHSRRGSCAHCCQLGPEVFNNYKYVWLMTLYDVTDLYQHWFE